MIDDRAPASQRPASAASPLATLLWCTIPMLGYYLVLRHLSFNTPVWDDYDTVLYSVLRLREAGSVGDLLGVLFSQHNDHRIVLTRLAALGGAAAQGAVDFRILMYLGNLALLGIFALAWAEYRDAVTAPLFAAAAFLFLQWSYNEASLMASAALPNIGVVFFSLGCLFFARRAGAAAALASLVFGLLAVGSQANGLLALTIAAVVAMRAGRKSHAALLGAAAALSWVLYFWSFTRPEHHPSMLEALAHPVDAAKLFLVVVGSVGHDVRSSIVLGIALLAAIAWLTVRGAWRRHPAAGLWLLFLLLSAAAAASGRVGFGVFYASRYALYSSAILLVVFLSACAVTGPWRPRRVMLALGGCIAFGLGVSWLHWPQVLERSFGGRLLTEVTGAGIPPLERYFGMQYTDLVRSARLLNAAGRVGLYRPPALPLNAPSIVVAATGPKIGASSGYVDSVVVSGGRVFVSGWNDLGATLAGRTFTFFPSGPVTAARHAAFIPRPDVAQRLRVRELLFSGFRVELDYASEAEARQVAATLCVAVEAPDQPARLLVGSNPACVDRTAPSPSPPAPG